MQTELSIELEPVECCNCGVVFWVSKRLVKNWKETKDKFFCPSGHGQSFMESTSEKLRKDIKSLELVVADKNLTINSLENRVSILTRKKRR